jgi:D-lactate dehydrogenase
MIAIRATGFENVDLNLTNSKSIVVSNVPSYGSHTVAEFTFGLILSLSRKILAASEKIREDDEFDQEGLKGFDLFDKTLGVVGTGKIGANVVKVARGFGMKILAFDVYPNENLAKEFAVTYVPLEKLLAESDVVTLHVPASEQTHHLINSQNIFKIKKGALLINTARGDVVETEALYKAISQGHLGGAGLDVLEGETKMFEDPSKEEFEPNLMKSLLQNNLLIRHPKVIVTPHTAFYTIEAEKAIMQTTLENIQGFITGLPKNVVKIEGKV